MQDRHPLREVGYGDLEEFIRKVYGKTYEVVPGEEWSNDSAHTFKISKEPLDEWCIERFTEFLETGEGSMILRTLLTDMCNKEIIPEGTTSSKSVGDSRCERGRLKLWLSLWS